MEVSIPSSYHPKIIGRKGQVIQKIRTEHAVQIQFPPVNGGESEPDRITLTGYEHNCEAAKEAILKIVKELVSVVLQSNIWFVDRMCKHTFLCYIIVKFKLLVIVPRV